MALHEAGLRVRDDIAVVGFDDIPVARLISPPLTPIAQCPALLGGLDGALLFERVAGTAPEGGRCETMPYELIMRKSA